MQISGIIPTIIADRLSFTGDNIIVKGTDVDIHIKDSGNVTDLYAIKVGKDYEIVELDDAANILSEYEEGDLISIDTITKLFMSAITNSLILSFNPFGKIKYGIKDKVDDVKGKFNDAKNKIQKGVDWLTDAMPIDYAQNYIRKQKGFSKAKVGKVELMNKKDGGNYKVMVGNPEDKTYSVWQLYRNGNDIRTLTLKKGLDANSAINEFDSLPGKNYDGSFKEGEDPYEANNIESPKQEKNNVNEGTQTTEDTQTESETNNVNEGTQTTEEPEQESEKDNVSDGTESSVELPDDNDPYYILGVDKNADKDTIKKAYRKLARKYHPDMGGNVDDFNKLNKAYKQLTASWCKYSKDSFEYKVSQAFKKKKKSKYNGMNVTGCTEADGTVALSSLKNNLDLFLIEYNKFPIRNREQNNFIISLFDKLRELESENRVIFTEIQKEVNPTSTLWLYFNQVIEGSHEYVSIDIDQNGVTIKEGWSYEWILKKLDNLIGCIRMTKDFH